MALRVASVLVSEAPQTSLLLPRVTFPKKAIYMKTLVSWSAFFEALGGRVLVRTQVKITFCPIQSWKQLFRDIYSFFI